MRQLRHIKWTGRASSHIAGLAAFCVMMLGMHPALAASQPAAPGMLAQANPAPVAPVPAPEAPPPAVPMPAAPPAAQAPAPAMPAPANVPPQQPIYSLSDLEYLLGPIALYPDSLLAILLPATAFPVQIDQADQWIISNPNAIAANDFSQVDAMPWDTSVQALTRFPDVVELLADHPDWTQSLGMAFSSQAEDVATTIQMLRAKAESVGNLQSTPQQMVTTREEGGSRVIYIAPTDPERIYVPIYDSSTVFYSALPSALAFGTGVFVGSLWNNRWGWNDRRWNTVWVHPPVWHAPPPSWHPHRPGSRPPSAWRPDRPGNRPGGGSGVRPDRPGNGIGSRPGNRPGSGLGNRPGDRPGMRPGDRPNVRPGDRPGSGGSVSRPQRPGGDGANRPSVQRPGGDGANRPSVQRPGGDGANRPTGQRPGGSGGANRPSGQRPSGGANRPTGQRPSGQRSGGGASRPANIQRSQQSRPRPQGGARPQQGARPQGGGARPQARPQGNRSGNRGGGGGQRSRPQRSN